MKKYRFGLGGVLRVREIVEEQSRAALVEAETEMAAAERQLPVARQHIARVT